MEFRDFDFSSKILGLLSPWTADLTYARDSTEAKKEKSHISKFSSKPCFYNHIHVMPLCLIPPRFPSVSPRSDVSISLNGSLPFLSFPDTLSPFLLFFPGAHPCLCPDHGLIRTEGPVLHELMDGTLFSRVRTADRTVNGCGSRHFLSDTRRYMYVGMIAVNGMFKKINVHVCQSVVTFPRS